MSKKQPENTPEFPRYEEVLLCAPGEDDKVTFVRTLKWMETIKTHEGDEVIGFLVTVPPTKALRIYSHICRNVDTHASIADKLPVVWNGKFTGCPLCNPNSKEGDKK